MEFTHLRISETLQASDELMTVVRLSQCACRRLQGLTHGEQYSDAHDICERLHQAREAIEQLEHAIELASGQTVIGSDNPDRRKESK